MKTRLLLADILFWVHFLIGIVWLGLFFVPLSVFPERIIFHFYLTLFIVVHQFLWGAILMPWTRKFRMVCVLTTPMQLLRGQKLSDPKNYDHSWFKEFVGRHELRIPHVFATILTFLVLIITTIQFLLSR